MRTYKRSLTMLSKATGTLGILGLASVAFVGVPNLVVAQQGAEKTSASALVGSYIIVAGEKDGKKIPDERLKGSSVRIAENAINTFDKDKKKHTLPPIDWTLAVSRGGSL